MKNKKTNSKNNIYKQHYLNFIFFLGINILEFYLKKEKPFSLLPSDLTGKRTFYLKNNKEFIVTDANINISKFEPKTNTTYIHNADGIRSKKNK